MGTKAKRTNMDAAVTIGRRDSKTWAANQIAEIQNELSHRFDKRSPAEILEINLKRVQFKMEAYADEKKGFVSLEAFVKAYLEVLNLSFRKFAEAIDTTDGNLKKYLSGERKFTKELAIRFAGFFHTTPDIWLRVDLKNELIQLRKEMKNSSRKKYDYRSVVTP